MVLVLAIVAPGQGAQIPGFLDSWLELPSFASRIDWFSSVTDMDLKYFGTQADEETIKDTSVAQPLLVASAMAAALEAFGSLSELQAKTDLIGGHSVGELAAAGLSNALSVEAALVFVRERGRSMAEAAKTTKTSMTAIIAGKEEEVLQAIADCGLTAANYNGSGQIVAAGTVEQLAQLEANPPARTRLVPLSVAGAFHTVHMHPAVARLEALAEGITPSDPVIPLISNRDGEIVESGADYLDRLVNQVAHPVRWDLCMRTMSAQKITGLMELAPAGTLTGIARRNLKDVERFNLNSPEDLEEAREFIQKHSSEVSA